MENSLLATIDALLDDHLEDTVFGVAELCTALNISQPQLYRRIKRATGQSTVQYIRTFRLTQGKKLLETTNLSVKTVAYKVGFGDPAYFSRVFSKAFGYPPSDLRK